MIDWHADPLWCLFAAAGIDPATMRPLPTPEPTDQADHRRQWQVEKRLNRAWRELEKAERRGSWHHLERSKQLAQQAFRRR